MGSPALWDHHRRNYNKNHDSAQPIEPKNLKKNSKNPAVTVVKTDSLGKKKKNN
jgi:hypothetical protein